LEALEYQMSRNLEALRERRETARFNQTFKGRVFNIMGRIFTIYCIMRVISVRAVFRVSFAVNTCPSEQSIYNVLFPSRRSSSSTTYPDLITDMLAYFLSRFYSESEIKTEDLASFARQLSLMLVGIIILSSIRLVLRGATRVGGSKILGV
jgi:hypothetical protein